jgi:hypothetical protein
MTTTTTKENTMKVSIDMDDAILAAERLAEHAENIRADMEALPVGSRLTEWHRDLSKSAAEYEAAADRIIAAASKGG